MYISKFSLFLVTLLSSAAIITEARLDGTWPPAGVTPPSNKLWNKLVNKTKLTNAPVLTTMGDCSQNPIDTCNWSCNNCIQPDDVLSCPTKKDWGLTFDDGPSDFTPNLLDFLDANNVKATFFVLGARVVEEPELIKRMVDSGHEVGVHTWSHPALTTKTTQQIIAEVKWTEKAIRAAAGVTPKLMRAPYGDIDDRVRGIMRQLGYTIVIWNKDSRDWVSVIDPTFQLAWVAGNFSVWATEDAPTGYISLEHDLYQQTAAQGPKIVPILKNAGWNIKTVSECTGSQAYLKTASSLNNGTPTDDNTTDPATTVQSVSSASLTSISTISLV
ncbi:2430_t:CDS:2, partial [Ambispora leptoticha]